MTNLKGSILMHAPTAWDQAFSTYSWDQLIPIEQSRQLAFANNLIHDLITAGVLAELSNGQDDDGIIDAVVHCAYCRDNEVQLVGDIRDLRRGDMLHVETPARILIHKHAVKSVDLSTGWIVFDNGDSYGWDDRHTLYRKPRPEPQHPDPAEHEYIFVYGIAGEALDTPLGMVAVRDGCYASSRRKVSPGAVTDWEPAVMTPKGGYLP